MVTYSTELAKVEEREELGFTLGKILAKLNENFFVEKGIIFRTGKHGTWVEMIIKEEAWGKKSVGTEGFEDYQDFDSDSMTLDRNMQQFSVPTDGLLKGTTTARDSISEFKSSIDI